MSEALVYTVQRLALFVVSLFVFALLGADLVLAVVLAALVSAGLSYLLLRRRRDAVAAKLAERLERRTSERAGRTDADTAAEDAAADRLASDRLASDRLASDRLRSEPLGSDRSAGTEGEPKPEK